MPDERAPIYLDHAATTPVDPRVVEAMLPFFTERFGNAASRHHAFGCDAARAVDDARERVAAVLHADPREIVWTSGATESVNLALKGTMPVDGHVVTVATEHKAVLDTCDALEASGRTVSVVPVDGEGRVDVARIADAITDRTALVSVMHANNEIGTMHPIGAIGALCRERGVLFHTDATQTFGRESIDVDRDHVDLLSASAHKCYGPKGVGLLFARRKRPRVRLAPLIHGGGHERGARSGSLNVPGIVGFGVAATLCENERETERARVLTLVERLVRGLTDALPAVVRNGAPDDRVAHIANLSFVGLDGDALMARIPDVAVSSSSACTSALVQPSYVLGAIGCDEPRMRGSVRFSAGRTTTASDIDAAVTRFLDAAAEVQRND